MTSLRHKDKVVVITGAASGIGAATALRFQAEGALVVASDIKRDQIEEFVATAGGAMTAQVTDVGSFDGMRDLIESAVDLHGRLDVVVNNAGIGAVGTVEEISLESWHRVIDVDLSSIFYSAKVSLPHLRRTRGNIVNTASISGLAANKSLGAYYAAKGGVVNFTRYLAVEHAHEGIRVNAVCPGPINSRPGMLDRGTLFDEYMANIPMKRLGVPDDVASAIAFLASDEASFITGHNLVIDGGLMAWTGEPDLRSHLPAPKGAGAGGGGASR